MIEGYSIWSMEIDAFKKTFHIVQSAVKWRTFFSEKIERIFIFLFDDTTTHIHIDFIRILEMERMRYLFKLNTRRIRNDKVEVKKEWTFDVKFRIFWEKLREKNVLLRRYVAKTHYEKWEIRMIKKIKLHFISSEEKNLKSQLQNVIECLFYDTFARVVKFNFLFLLTSRFRYSCFTYATQRLSLFQCLMLPLIDFHVGF